MTTAHAPTTTRRPLPDWLALVGLLVASYGVAALGGLASASNVDGWYADADKPPLTPPDWLFGPTWTLLYGLMAVAAWLVWRRREHAPAATRVALTLWWVQLGLNLAWTPVFFALEQLWLGLAVIITLDVVLLVLILRVRHLSRVAAGLLVPYLVWIVFATWLNAGVAWLN